MLTDMNFRRSLQSKPKLVEELCNLSEEALECIGRCESKAAHITSNQLKMFLEFLDDDDDWYLDWKDIIDSIYAQAKFVTRYEHGPNCRRKQMWTNIERICYLFYRHSQTPQDK